MERRTSLICFAVKSSDADPEGVVLDAPKPSSEELSRQAGSLEKFSTYVCDMRGGGGDALWVIIH